MSKITAYTALTAPAAADVLPAVDVSDTSMAATGTTKKITIAGLLAAGSRTAVTVPAPTGTAATDSANIRAGLTAANAAGGGVVFLQGGTYVGDTGVFAVPSHVTLYFQQNTQLTVNCTGGATVDAITIDYAGVLYAEGEGSSALITASATCNVRTVISNANHTLQEYCYIQGMSVFVASGATIAVAVMEQVSTFTNSRIRDVIIDGQTFNTGVPLLRIAGNSAANNGLGPVTVENSWFRNSGGDCVLITDAGDTGDTSVWLQNCTIEHPADGYHNVHLTGTGGLDGVRITGVHFENNTTTTTGPAAAVYIDGCAQTVIEDMQFYSSAITNKIGVWISSNAHNGLVRVTSLANLTDVQPVIRDDSTGNTISYASPYSGPPGDGWVHEFNGAGYLPVRYGSFVLGSDLIWSSQTVALASTAVDARKGVVVDVAALAAAVVVAAPLFPQKNQMLIYRFVENGTGGFAVTWNAIFRVAAGVVSTTASKASVVAFRYDSSLSAWVQLWATTGV